MQTAENQKAEATVSLSNLKEKARRLLPIDSSTRAMILTEKDFLPISEAFARFEVFDRLLASELNH